MVASGENFTPSDLMRRYAKENSGVEFGYNQYFESELKIAGEVYRYDHWAIKPESDGFESVTLFMCKKEKQLYNYYMTCNWVEGGYREEISVLAERLDEAWNKAKMEVQNKCGAPIDEISITGTRRERVDLGLLLYKSVKAYGKDEQVADYIEMGADVNYRFEPEVFNYCPLHLAAYYADLGKITMLVEAGCDMNPMDKEGCTPLDLAIARHNYPHVVEYLEEHGAMRGLDVMLHNARERSKETVEHIKEHDFVLG